MNIFFAIVNTAYLLPKWRTFTSGKVPYAAHEISNE